MAIPLDETSDNADAAFGSNPEGTRHMAPIAALLAPDWAKPNGVARALHWEPSASFAHVAQLRIRPRTANLGMVVSCFKALTEP